MCVPFSFFFANVSEDSYAYIFWNTSLLLGVLGEELFQIVLELNYSFDEIERFSIDEGNGNDKFDWSNSKK